MVSEGGPLTIERGPLTTLIFYVLLASMGGLLAELSLQAHYEDATQIIPLVLLAGGLIVLIADRAAPRRWTRALVQLMMALLIVGGMLGMYFHFRGSREFQLEMDPQIAGTTLVWSVLRAKSPPTLSPGRLMQMGLLGLGYAYVRRTR